jgi:hypothetical protein
VENLPLWAGAAGYFVKLAVDAIVYAATPPSWTKLLAAFLLGQLFVFVVMVANKVVFEPVEAVVAQGFLAGMMAFGGAVAQTLLARAAEAKAEATGTKGPGT